MMELSLSATPFDAYISKKRQFLCKGAASMTLGHRQFCLNLSFRIFTQTTRVFFAKLIRRGNFIKKLI